jgi:hypothetical protein
VPDSRTRAPCPKRLRSIQGCKCVCVIAAMNYCQRSHRSFYMQYSTGRPVSAYECIERRNASNLSNLVVIFPVICCKKWSNPSNLLREENLLEILIPLYRLLGLLHVLQQITGKITLRLLGLLQGRYFFSTSHCQTQVTRKFCHLRARARPKLGLSGSKRGGVGFSGSKRSTSTARSF